MCIRDRLSKLSHLKKYETNSKLINRIPNFAVRMGFGLHVGWGIEGAIGSMHKIDASYLSPNVNIAARLESCTRQYGIPLLISGQVYNMLSPIVQRYCREIDNIMVKGCLLYTSPSPRDLSTSRMPSSA
eukprot:TRINITY_DN4284_c0_g1_i2.p3 TRINITY_DN4284_c0_g1~~TRINITY_DN4284_c0_g1_i2.p3  ORF type:complete len:129 (-),score=32.29 TRINITY_DN4284_c0_g1_i2:10-396(-)